MITDERKAELSKVARDYVVANTCTKAHSGTVGECPFCERDALKKRIDECVEMLDNLLGEMSGHSLIDDEDFTEINRVRDLLATGECKPRSE